MQLSDFDYELPDDLIARYPSSTRGESRLLVLNGRTEQLQHHRFVDITQFLNPGDLLVFNNTRVISARLFATKSSGGKVEVMVERLQSENTVLAQIRASKTPKLHSQLYFEQGITATVLDRQADFFVLQFADITALEVMDKIGHIPLPPYFGRADEHIDRERYQTVYALHNGAVAAPTAGLHFDEGLINQLQAKGVETAFVTLHVGAGTFQPVRVSDITAHTMHREYMEVSEMVCEKIKATKARGCRVIAVGTTSLRSLETAAQSGVMQVFKGDTQIFIYPGYSFQVVDALITNFHQPQSTLMMLVCAFAGYKPLMEAYRLAIEMRYRFLSYGDAMFLERSF